MHATKTLPLAAPLLALLLRPAAAPAQPPGAQFDPAGDRVVYPGEWRWTSHGGPDPTEVWVVSLADGAESLLWDGEQPVSDVTFAPGGGHVAFIEHFSAPAPPEEANYASPQPAPDGTEIVLSYLEEATLVILTDKGALEAAIPRVRRYAWSPDGSLLAYLTGDYSEGGAGFLSTGAWIYDLGAGSADRIFEGGYDLAWADFDRRLYLWYPADPAAPVLAYDLQQRTLKATAHAGIYFSPDGAYCYRPGYEGDPFLLEFHGTSLVSGGLEVTGENGLFSAHRYANAYPSGWLDERTLVLTERFGPEGSLDLLVDVEDASYQELDGRVLAAVDRSGGLVVFRAGRVERMDRAQLPTVRPVRPLSRPHG